MRTGRHKARRTGLPEKVGKMRRSRRRTVSVLGIHVNKGIGQEWVM